MKVYGKTTSTERKVQKIFCNQCGRPMKIENGIVREGIFSAEVSFGYFSKKDGIRQEFDLCEECYDRMIRQKFFQYLGIGGIAGFGLFPVR